MVDYMKTGECYDLLQDAIHKIPCNATTLDSCSAGCCIYHSICSAILKAQEEISKLYTNQ